MTIVWILGGLALMAGLGGYAIRLNLDPFRGLDRPDLQAYAESSKSFAGTVYLLEGTVEDQLGYRAGQGKLIGIRCASLRGTVFVPLLVPDSMNSFQPQKGQNLKIQVRGDARGLMVAQRIQKQ